MIMSVECEDTSYYKSSKGLHKDLTSSSLNIDDLDKEDLAEMEVDAKMLSEAARIQTSFCNSSIQCFLQLIHKSKRQTRNPLTVWRLYSPGRPVPFGVEVQDGIVSDENELYLKSKPLNKCASPVITGIQFSPTNPMLMALTTSSGGVFFVDLEVQSEAQNSSILFNLLSVYYISCGAALCGKFSSDGFVFAVGGHDDLVTLIDVEACLNGYGSFSGVLLEGHDNWVNDLHIESFKATDTIKGKANSSQHGFSTERFKTVYKIWSVGEDGKFCTFEVDRRKVLRKRNNMQSQNSWASLDRTLPREAGDLKWKSLDRSIATRICSPNMQTAVQISAQTVSCYCFDC
jgi:WD40 repeat protein